MFAVNRKETYGCVFVLGDPQWLRFPFPFPFKTTKKTGTLKRRQTHINPLERESEFHLQKGSPKGRLVSRLREGPFPFCVGKFPLLKSKGAFHGHKQGKEPRSWGLKSIGLRFPILCRKPRPTNLEYAPVVQLYLNPS